MTSLMEDAAWRYLSFFVVSERFLPQTLKFCTEPRLYYFYLFCESVSFFYWVRFFGLFNGFP